MKKRNALLASLFLVLALTGSPQIAQPQSLCDLSPWLVVAVVSENAPFFEVLPSVGSCRDDALKSADKYRKDRKNPIATAHAIPIITYCALLLSGYAAGDSNGCPVLNP
jgi:hypothetical protein